MTRCALYETRLFALTAVALLAFSLRSRAQENPYIVTYDHYLDESGNLEV